jgi:hypothetical protein
MQETLSKKLRRLEGELSRLKSENVELRVRSGPPVATAPAPTRASTTATQPKVGTTAKKPATAPGRGEEPTFEHIQIDTGNGVVDATIFDPEKIRAVQRSENLRRMREGPNQPTKRWERKQR